ncbi:hypothetical protein [uncultured Schumannella sp.]|uniref:hypothetical protein n=1 Tax=uncultured Schumannella sp. TaxID=1195956 RepID=UPI0025D73E66|nr:hypothetical protein [uncultured Schumannella sp.]
MNGVSRLERVIDLPRSIVWEALVDPILSEGWLHPDASLLDGVEVLERRDPVAETPELPAILESDGPHLGHVRVEVTESRGGTRGGVTEVVLTVPQHIDDRFRAPLIAGWQTRLDQLEGLLRGHPVDWDNWERDHGADYESHLVRAATAASP